MRVGRDSDGTGGEGHDTADTAPVADHLVRRRAITIAMPISTNPTRRTIGPMVAHNEEPVITDPRSTPTPCRVHTNPTALRTTPGTRNGQIRFTGPQ